MGYYSNKEQVALRVQLNFFLFVRKIQMSEG